MPSLNQYSDSEIDRLYHVLDERNDTIDQLQRKIDLLLEGEVGEQQESLHLVLAENHELKALNERLQDKVESTGKSLQEALSELRILQQELQTQKEISDDVNRRLLQKDEEIATIKSRGDNQYFLEKEALQLREMINEFERNEIDLVSEIEHVSSQRREVELIHAANLQELEKLQISVEEESLLREQYESENKLLLGKCKTLQEKQEKLQRTFSESKQEHEKQIQQLQQELEQERKRNTVLDEKEALSLGQLRHHEQENQVETLHYEIQLNQGRVDTLEMERNVLKKDLDAACVTIERLKVEKENLEQSVLDVKKNQTETIRNAMQDLQKKKHQLSDERKSLEERLSQTQDELQSSEERNRLYEEGCGLIETVALQRKTEMDLRKSEAERKHLNNRISDQTEKINFLVKTVELLQEGGRIVDHALVKNVINKEQSSIVCQNQELKAQIESLEAERKTLLSRLRQNATLMSSKFPFNLDSDHTQKVIDFMEGLQKGSLQLPLNDKSIELIAEVQNLRSLRRSDVYTIDRLEREIEVLKMRDGAETGHLEAAIQQLTKKVKEQSEKQIELVSTERSQINEAKILGLKEEVAKLKKVESSLNAEIEKLRNENEILISSFEKKEKPNHKRHVFVQTVLATSDNDTNMLEVELQTAKDQLELKSRELTKCKKKLLQMRDHFQQLERHNMVRVDDERINVAHAVVKELKASLEAKNASLSRLREALRVKEEKDEKTCFQNPNKNENQLATTSLDKDETSIVTALREKVTSLTLKLAVLTDSKEHALRRLQESEITREKLAALLQDHEQNDKEIKILQKEVQAKNLQLFEIQKMLQEKENKLNSLTMVGKRLERSLKENEVTTKKLTEAEALCKQLKATLYSVKRTKEKVMKSEQNLKKLFEEGQKDLSMLDEELVKTRKRLTVAIEEKLYFEKSVLSLRQKLKERETKKQEKQVEKSFQDMKKLKQENTSLRSLVAVQQLRKQGTSVDKSCLTDPFVDNLVMEKNEKHLSELKAVKQNLGEEKLKVEALQKMVERNKHQEKMIGKYEAEVKRLEKEKASMKVEYEEKLGELSKADESDLNEKLIELHQKNEKLRAELGVFDLEFFESLEDLKYNYSEAKKKLIKHGLN